MLTAFNNNLDREESITEFAFFWNKRKIVKMPEELKRRYEKVLKFEFVLLLLFFFYYLLSNDL